MGGGDKDASCMRMCMQYNVKWTRLAKVASCHSLPPRVSVRHAQAISSTNTLHPSQIAWTATQKIRQISRPTPCNGYQRNIMVGVRESHVSGWEVHP